MLPQTKATYVARACGAATFSEPTASGNFQIAVPMEVTQGEHAGERIAWIATFHTTIDKKGKNGIDRIIESLQAMGWRGDELMELAEIDDARAMQLMPDEVEIVCDLDEYNGEWKLKVKWVNKPGAGRFAFKETLSGSGLKAFSAQMRNTIRNAQGAQRAQQPRATQQPHPNAPGFGPKDDSDIPF